MLLYGAGAIAVVVVLYAVVHLAVRSALRASLAEQRASAGRQEDLLRSISASAEYVADVADAWAEGEAAHRAGGPAESLESVAPVELGDPPPAPRAPIAVRASAAASASPPDHDHAGTGEGSD